jgi:hypothetical protein
VTLDSTLSFSANITRSCRFMLYNIRRVRLFLTQEVAPGPYPDTCHLPSSLLQLSIGWAPCLWHQTSVIYSESRSPLGVQTF